MLKVFVVVEVKTYFLAILASRQTQNGAGIQNAYIFETNYTVQHLVSPVGIFLLF